MPARLLWPTRHSLRLTFEERKPCSDKRLTRVFLMRDGEPRTGSDQHHRPNVVGDAGDPVENLLCVDQNACSAFFASTSATASIFFTSVSAEVFSFAASASISAAMPARR